MKKLSRNPVIVFLIFCACFLLVIQTGQIGDRVSRGIVWALFLGMGAVAVVKMIRRRSFTPYGQTGTVPKRVRRWVEGESDGGSLDSRESHEQVIRK
jgi:hypothetical protein